MNFTTSVLFILGVEETWHLESKLKFQFTFYNQRYFFGPQLLDCQIKTYLTGLLWEITDCVGKTSLELKTIPKYINFTISYFEYPENYIEYSFIHSLTIFFHRKQMIEVFQYNIILSIFCDYLRWKSGLITVTLSERKRNLGILHSTYSNIMCLKKNQ